ncbi:hypothetical protein FDI40_gp330 [Agrobacterium phage Atu_ph07]|uniref:WGR domain-containing protein n=1 Tax=Agrobacterium phage Atu_ph07 TaxID=2024264 RepID=A0A2L0UZX9_9CAUD|nr:hypothetical protein FDI40_gp330 [Agrobacterium phage Atu_ph07]AUZ95089.1 hypothetical protein [Agrobacterium phage Atu_ph07]
MSKFEIVNFLYYKSPRSNKFWAIIRTGDKYYRAWGRNGEEKKMTFKYDRTYNISLKKMREKIKDGYTEAPIDTIDRYNPDFKDRAEEKLLLDLLYGNVK